MGGPGCLRPVPGIRRHCAWTRTKRIFRTINICPVSKATQLIRGLVESAASVRRRSGRTGNLLIVKLDGIGDYIIFRNFIRALKKSDQYGRYRLHLLGNAIYRELVEAYDSEYLSECHWVKPAQVNRLTGERIKLLLWLGGRSFDIALNPSYSREFAGDNLVRLSKAPERIGMEGDTWNMSAEEKARCDLFYTKLVPHTGDRLFEFERYRIFFRSLLGKEGASLDDFAPSLPVRSKVSEKNDARFVASIFLGANDQYRKWPASHFRRLVLWLEAQEKISEILLLGGPGEQNDARLILDGLGSSKSRNLAGTTNLKELVEHIGRSDLLVTHDSCGVHIGMATPVKHVLCLSSGNHYGRFLPYPEACGGRKLRVLLPIDETALAKGEGGATENLYEGRQVWPLADLEPERVIDALKAMLRP